MFRRRARTTTWAYGTRASPSDWVGLSRLWDDPRVARGFRAQLARRRDRLGAGEAHLGWKLGFGAPAALERLGLTGPLVGYLMRQAVVSAGGSVSVAGWVRPVAEPEIAVYLSRPLSGGSGREAAKEAIGAVGPAIELADVEFPPDDVEAILAANIYQRAVVLGSSREAGAGGDIAGIEARVLQDGREHARTDEPEALTGELVALVAHVADLLASAGTALRAGDVVIAGSVVPPLDATAGGEVRLELGRLGAVEVTILP